LDKKLAIVTEKNEKLIDKLWKSKFSISILALLSSLIVLIVMSIIYGANPMNILISLFQGSLGDRKSLIYTSLQTAPLILTGLAVLIPYKAGFFNVGGQGQLLIGAIAAVFVSTNFHSSIPLATIVASLLASVIGGIIVVLVPLFLKIKSGISEVTTTIMANYLCLNLVYGLITGTMKNPEAFYGTTRIITEEFRLPELLQINVGVWLAIAIALSTAWFMKYSIFGMELKAIGINKEAAITIGISYNKTLIISVIYAAAIAGLAGGIIAMAITYGFAEGCELPWGFTGICIAFLGRNSLGVIPFAFILAMLETGSRYMQSMTGAPSSMIDIMQGIPVLFYLIFNFWLSNKKQSNV
jgi:general nucleoside transport system permease protein